MALQTALIALIMAPVILASREGEAGARDILIVFGFSIVITAFLTALLFRLWDGGRRLVARSNAPLGQVREPQREAGSPVAARRSLRKLP